MKYCAIFATLIFSSYFGASLGNNWEPCGGEWEQYKDEKCFQIIESDHPTQSFEGAIEKCATLEDTSTLVMIQSREEQNFLVNFLFKTHKKVDNFWIGARYSNSSFKWLDNSELSFANWDSNYPRGENNNSCVQIQAKEDVAGKWTNEPCEKRNAIVCQKLQFWSIEQLQKSFIKARQEFNVALAKVETNVDVANENNKNLRQSLENVTLNPVPIGFIYVQISNQSDPQTLWSTVQWADVTSEYSGLFFRAEGGNSTEFGTIQPENAPRLTEVGVELHAYSEGIKWGGTKLKVGDKSSGIGVYSGSGSNTATGHFTLRFYQSGGEVRPKNAAMRIWKRIG